MQCFCVPTWYLVSIWTKPVCLSVVMTTPVSIIVSVTLPVCLFVPVAISVSFVHTFIASVYQFYLSQHLFFFLLLSHLSQKLNIYASVVKLIRRLVFIITPISLNISKVEPSLLFVSNANTCVPVLLLHITCLSTYPPISLSQHILSYLFVFLCRILCLLVSMVTLVYLLASLLIPSYRLPLSRITHSLTNGMSPDYV